MFQTKVAEKIKICIFCSTILYFQKSLRLLDNVEKYDTARQAREDTTAHAYCMLAK